MDELAELITYLSGQAVAMCESQRGGGLDYSEASLAIVEEMLADASGWKPELESDELLTLMQRFGCYILEVGRTEFGGQYLWLKDRDQPALVVAEPEFYVAMVTFDKVRGRLGGDTGDNIPFFYAGFAERARQRIPGTHALYV